MTTHVICDNCGEKFKSQYQIAPLDTNLIFDNTETCPHCRQQTLTEKRNLINVYPMGDSKGREYTYQCPECSNIQGEPKEHKYNMVKFEVGEIEAKCPNCNALLTRKITQ